MRTIKIQAVKNTYYTAEIEVADDADDDSIHAAVEAVDGADFEEIGEDWRKEWWN